jgi:hypothetical protein
MVSCILLFCVLYSIRYIFYDRHCEIAGLFSKNLRDTALKVQSKNQNARIKMTYQSVKCSLS